MVSGTGSSRRLEVQVWVRQHERSAFIPIPDPDRRDPWQMPIELPEWYAPVVSAAASPDAEPAPTPDPATTVVEAPVMPVSFAPVTIRSVTLKFFKLKEHEQRRVIVQLELDDETDHNLKDYELAIAAVRRSEQRGRLADLNEKIESVIASHE